MKMEPKSRKYRKSLLFFSKSIMLLLIFLVFAAVWWFLYPDARFWRTGNLLVLGFYATVLIGFSSLYGAIRIGILRLGEVIYSFILTLVVCNLLAYAQFSLIARTLVNPLWLVLATAVQFVIASVGAFYINRLYFRINPAREVAVVYSKRDQARSIIEKMSLKKDRYRVCVAICEAEGYDTIVRTIDSYSSVMFCGIDERLRYKLYSHCSLLGKRVYVLPNFEDVFIRSSHLTQLFDTPVFYTKNSGLSTEEMMFKRVMDVFISIIALIFFSPFMLVIAVCIKLCDKGPVFYKQNRLTQDGRIFELYKFRSMYVDAEEKSGARLSSVNDDRITPVGRVIRKLRLDETPQFINILRGDMSVVGPRPERPEIMAMFRNDIPEFALRLKVKAGLTGYAQIFGRYNTSMRDKLLLDLLYTENYSILMDLRMLFMTVKVLFMPESTEGVGEESELAGYDEAEDSYGEGYKRDGE